MTTLHITIGSRTAQREKTLQQLDATDADSESWGDQRVLNFATYADLVTNLSPLRLELVRAIAELEPESMREAARLVDRDISDVHADLRQLEILDVIELEEGGPGQPTRPIVPYNRIEFDIDVPLVDNDSPPDTVEA